MWNIWQSPPPNMVQCNHKVGEQMGCSPKIWPVRSKTLEVLWTSSFFLGVQSTLRGTIASLAPPVNFPASYPVPLSWTGSRRKLSPVFSVISAEKAGAWTTFPGGQPVPSGKGTRSILSCVPTRTLLLLLGEQSCKSPTSLDKCFKLWYNEVTKWGKAWGFPSKIWPVRSKLNQGRFTMKKNLSSLLSAALIVAW